MRHARASEVKIDVGRQNGHLVISVSDDGVGIRPENMDSESSLGLLGMKERAKIIGGTIDIMSLPGKGTRITMRLPL
jgi:signal transduction histidine kinase